MNNSSDPKKYKNSFLNWIEFRLPIVSYIERERFFLAQNPNTKLFISHFKSDKSEIV